MHKRIISAFIKTLQIKLLLLSAAKLFNLRSIYCILSIVSLGNEVSTAMKCFILLLDN